MENICITNFKLLHRENSQSLALAPISFIVGKNNSGKSSYIEALSVFSYLHEIISSERSYQFNEIHEAYITRLINQLFYQHIDYTAIFNSHGTFHHIKNNSSESDIIGFQFNTPSTQTKVEYEITAPHRLSLNKMTVSISGKECVELMYVPFQDSHHLKSYTRVMKINTDRYFDLLAKTSKKELLEYVRLYKIYIDEVLENNFGIDSEYEKNEYNIKKTTLETIPAELHTLCKFLASKNEIFQKAITQVEHSYNLIDATFLENFNKRYPELLSNDVNNLDNCRAAFEITTTWHDYWNTDQYNSILYREKMTTTYDNGFSSLYKKSHRVFFMENPESGLVSLIGPNFLTNERWDSYLTAWGELFLEFIAYDLNANVIKSTIIEPFRKLYFTKVTNRRFQDYTNLKSRIPNELSKDVSLLLSDKETIRLSNVFKTYQINKESIESTDSSVSCYKIFQTFIQSFDEWDDIILNQNLDTLDYYIYIEKKNGDVMYINDEGYGTNQVVPILVKIAAAIERNKRETIIIEEPELALHPSAQSLLVEFFCNIYLSTSIRFMLETHSEYMIRKTQYLIASTNSTLSSDDCIIHSFKKGISTNDIEIKSIHFKPNGELSDELPNGFMDEANKISLSVLALQRSQNN
ncbi:MAG TPA: hypothetical protein DCL43_07810 [Chitinophagaceae bacterium]|nr:hypothetical protein [Chitinophagaceae bacterium]HAN38629.1 hypothetical protein [Chitinophagaceae bacterium]